MLEKRNPDLSSCNTNSIKSDNSNLIPEITSYNQQQVSNVLCFWGNNEFTFEENLEIENFLSAWKFDTEDFLKLSDKLRWKYLILRIIKKIGDWLSVVQNLELFNGLDEEIAIKLIEAWEWWSVWKNIEKFNTQDYSNIVLHLLDEWEEESIFIEAVGMIGWTGRVIDHKFNGLINKKVALKLIEKWYDYMVLYQLWMFHWLDREIFSLLRDKIDIGDYANFSLTDDEIIEEIHLAHDKSYILAWFYDYLYKSPKFSNIICEILLSKSYLEEIDIKILLDEWFIDKILNSLTNYKDWDIKFQELFLYSIEAYIGGAGSLELSKIDFIGYLQESGEKRNIWEENFRELINKMRYLIMMQKSNTDVDRFLLKNIPSYILSLVYSIRDYSPKNLDKYSDKSEHLEKYSFNPEGYNFSLSNFLGYKLREGRQLDTALLDDYKARIANITQISKDRHSLKLAVHNLAQVQNISLKTAWLESQILEFLLTKEASNITKEDFDILIAYQLMGKIEQFIKNSNDKLPISADTETMHMVQILSLLQEYWDPLKESIRKIEKIALKKDTNDKIIPDFKLLLRQFGRNTPKEIINLNKDRIINSIVQSFANRPEHSITDSVIKKSILEKCKSVLQKTNITREEQEEFAKSFDTQDFIWLSDIEKQEAFIKKWKQQVEEHFWSTDSLGLNLRSISKVQQSIYSTLQQETKKFEKIVDKNGGQNERHIFARFGKNKYDALARGVGDICLGVDEWMWENREYFELVLFDTDRLKCIGTVMLLNMPEPDGKKYLLYCPNPSIEFDDKVSSFNLFDQIYKIVKKFAQDNNFDGVLFNPTNGLSTNRSWDFQTALEQSQLKDIDGKIMKIDLKKEHVLWRGYEYRNNLSFLYIKS